MTGVLQEGIFWDIGSRPGNHFKLVFLRVSPGVDAAQVREHLSALWSIWRDLAAGIVPELGADFVVPDGRLRTTIGFGRKLFDLEGVGHSRPDALGPKNDFLSPRADGGGKLLPGSGIQYQRDVIKNPATEEVVVQFVGDTALSVHRAHVETWRYLEAHLDVESGSPPLQITGFFDGFSRDDRRSWIGFHDGISNLEKGNERRSVVAIKPENAGQDQWTVGGTYMVFMRLPVDLALWNALSREEQELLVGRAKGTGCAFEAARDGKGVAVAGCPAAGPTVGELGNERFREPPVVADSTIRVSHVQRANQHQKPVSRVNSRRIYRQGFEFLEPAGITGAVRVGLNFVSFQDDPERTLAMLTLRNWLGGVSFGGADDSQEGVARLVEARAAGTYFIPPVREGDAFPGAFIFGVPA